MTSISFASEYPRADAQSGDQSFKAIVLFCCWGLAAAFCVISLGVPLVAAS
jgi:hypothetical protein